MENYNSNVGFTMVDMVETESQADKDSVVDKKKRELSLDNDLTLQVFFYRLMKPITLVDENGKDLYPRESEIVVNDFTKNVYFIHKDPIVDTGKNGDRFRKVRAIVSQGEESLEMQQLSRDANTFRNMVKRRVYINEDISFLQEGIWVASVNKELDKDSDLTKVWFYAGNQASMYFAKGEVDNARSMELVSAIMEDQANLVILQQLDQFNTVNGNALILKWESPKKLLSSETQAPKLDRIEVRGKWRETLVNTIQLKGYDKLLQTLADISIPNNSFSFIGNPIKVDKETLLYLPWTRNLTINDIKKYAIAWENDTTVDKENSFRLADLLLFGEEKPDEPITQKGKLTNLMVRLEKIDLSKTKINIGGVTRKPINIANDSGRKLIFGGWVDPNDPNKQNTYLGEQYVNNPFGWNNVTISFRWNNGGNGPEDVAKGLSDYDATNRVMAYRVKLDWQSLTYQKDDGTFSTLYPAKPVEIPMIFKGKNSGSDQIQELVLKENDIIFSSWSENGHWIGFSTGDNYCFGVIGSEEGELPYINNDYWDGDPTSAIETFPSFKDWKRIPSKVWVREWTSSSDVGGDFQIYGGINQSKGEFKAQVVNENNSARLYDLLRKMVSYSWYYKNGFPNARYNEGGVELNMSALIKSAFTNSNYTPQQVITNLVEDYKLEHPKDLITPQWENFMWLLPAMSSYIMSDYNVNGGLNDQHKILMPFYCEITGVNDLSSDLGGNTWTDQVKDKTNDYQHIEIYGSGSTYKAWKSGETVDNPDGWKDRYFLDIRATFKSEWFNFEFVKGDNDLYNDIIFTPKKEVLNKPMSIELGSVSRTFHEISDSLSESDIITIATDMNLSNDYINYDLALLGQNEEVVKHMTSIIANKELKTFTKKDIIKIFGSTNDSEPYVIDLSNQNLNDFIPTNMTWKGVFGVPINLKFVYKTQTQDGEDLVEESVEFDINLYNEKDDSVVKTEIIL